MSRTPDRDPATGSKAENGITATPPKETAEQMTKEEFAQELAPILESWSDATLPSPEDLLEPAVGDEAAKRRARDLALAGIRGSLAQIDALYPLLILAESKDSDELAAQMRVHLVAALNASRVHRRNFSEAEQVIVTNEGFQRATALVDNMDENARAQAEAAALSSPLGQPLSESELNLLRRGGHADLIGGIIVKENLLLMRSLMETEGAVDNRNLDRAGDILASALRSRLESTRPFLIVFPELKEELDASQSYRDATDWMDGQQDGDG